MSASSTAADFTLSDQSGAPRRLADLLEDGPVVLFFYPKAMTSGCTAEACHFRDLGAEFADLGAQRVGISKDDVAAQRGFADAHDLDYPLLSDPDGHVAGLFGAKRPTGVLPRKRKTIVIAADGEILETVTSELSMQVHADRALKVLRAHAG